MLKEDKKSLVKDLTVTLQEAKSVVLVNYSGLNVKGQQELKAKLNAINGRMIVIKNTLLKKACEAAGLDKEILKTEIFEGQTALVIATEDAVAPIQVLGKFAKEHDLPKFKVGVVDGTFYDSLSLSQIANLPSRDVLLSQVLGSLMSNMYNLVGTLNGPMQKLVYILDQKSKMQGGENK